MALRPILIRDMLMRCIGTASLRQLQRTLERFAKATVRLVTVPIVVINDIGNWKKIVEHGVYCSHRGDSAIMRDDGVDLWGWKTKHNVCRCPARYSQTILQTFSFHLWIIYSIANSVSTNWAPPWCLVWLFGCLVCCLVCCLLFKLRPTKSQPRHGRSTPLLLRWLQGAQIKGSIRPTSSRWHWANIQLHPMYDQKPTYPPKLKAKTRQWRTWHTQGTANRCPCPIYWGIHCPSHPARSDGRSLLSYTRFDRWTDWRRRRDDQSSHCACLGGHWIQIYVCTHPAKKDLNVPAKLWPLLIQI